MRNQRAGIGSKKNNEFVYLDQHTLVVLREVVNAVRSCLSTDYFENLPVWLDDMEHLVDQIGNLLDKARPYKPLAEKKND